jgi:1,4-alpha-glucan branching enzyme
MKGALLLVLHAHLPFVRHPEHEDFLEEDWLYEAVTETYLPLLLAFERLRDQNIPFRLCLTLSPTLLSMLTDPLLMGRYARRLDRLLELTGKERLRTRLDPEFSPLAAFYQERFEELREAFHGRYHRDLVSAFKGFQDSGHLEILTCGATHGFLPLMQGRPEAVRAQVHVAAQQYRALFGRAPRGIWLPECGYYPGVERFLAEVGLRFFFLDTHGIEDAQPRPPDSVYAPLFTPWGLAAYGRDPESSRQVWAAETGYPGDPVYREFYRDLGFDLPLDYVRPYIQPTGERKNTGIKYHRITGKTEQKEAYVPEDARARARAHAADFVAHRERQVKALGEQMGRRSPVVVAPYDAELFGHWWFEGPWFLEELIRLVSQSPVLELGTPVTDLASHPENACAQPPLCSWGERGYAQMWLDGSNDWIYPHLDACAGKMVALARDFPQAAGLEARALNQAARELLLAQSSDWAFIMKTGTMVAYAVRRTREHLLNFLGLEEQVRQGAVDAQALSRLEERHNLFPALDYRVYQPDFFRHSGRESQPGC